MKVLFAGSFDPFTTGHADIVERGLRMFDRVAVGVGYNERKPGAWPVEERVKAIAALYASEPRVEVLAYTGLTAECARRIGAGALLRSVRGMTDFDYESNLAAANRAVGGIDTVFLAADPRLGFVSSSLVRELLHNGADATRYIAGDPAAWGISGNAKVDK